MLAVMLSTTMDSFQHMTLSPDCVRAVHEVAGKKGAGHGCAHVRKKAKRIRGWNKLVQGCLHASGV